jgi:hypothetical protein
MYAILIGILLPFSIQPVQVDGASPRGHLPETFIIKSKDEDAVKAACKLWWNLPEMKTTSKEDMHRWAKSVLPAAGKALNKAAEAKRLNSKWSQFELEMATFNGSIYLGTDIRYAGVMFKTTIEKNALSYLAKTCAKRR